MRKTPPIVGCAALPVLLAWATSAGAANPTLALQGSLAGASGAFDGYSVAISGNTAVVGAIDDASGLGAAYVLARTGTSWSVQQELTASDGAAGDEFGYAVAISGGTVMVGAASKGAGAVYVFTRSGSSWSLAQEIAEPGGGQSGDCFGCALALSGTTAAIGAPGMASNVGGAFVFANGGATWAKQAQFSGANAGDYFGFSVALSPDQSTALVGAFGTGNEAGSAYFFQKSGASWTQPQPAVTAPGGGAGQRFGYAVAVSGGLALIGAYAAGSSGAAYAFASSGSGWSQVQKLTPSDATGNDFYGASVALDGTTAVVGAYEHAGATGPGAVYVYGGGGPTGWPQPAQELAAPPGGQYFGFAVAGNGGTVAAGAFGAGNDSGAAYLFAPSVVNAPALGGGYRVLALALLLAGAGAFALRSGRRPDASGALS